MRPPPPPDPRPEPGLALPARVLLVGGGTVALGLGIVGTVVPLLPSTPLVLVAAACYVRAWPSAYRRLQASRMFGPILRSGEEGRYLPPRAKVVSVSLTAVSFAATIAFAVKAWPFRALLVALGLTIILWLLSLPTRPRAARRRERYGVR